MDYIMRSNSPEFMMGGANVLEKIGHALHMHEMWTRSAEIFHQLKAAKVTIILR